MPRPISAANQASGFQQTPVGQFVNTVAHELAHTDPLGALNDEYGDPGRAGPNPQMVSDVEFVENAPNTQLLDNVRMGNGPGLNVMQVKWNWERVEGAARVQTIKEAGSEIEIGILVEDIPALPTLSPGRILVLRGKSLAAPAPGSGHTGTTPPAQAPQFLNFVSFDSGLNLRCTLLGAATPKQVMAAFPPGSVILVPRLFAGSIVRIIPGPLGNQLAATGPFSASAAPCTPIQQPRVPNIVGFRWPKNQLQAVAAYEVGASFNCGVIHPAGECKMNNSLNNDFCFVCKYTMIYTVDPTKLPALDAEYP